MTEADILATTYEDTVTVYRAFRWKAAAIEIYCEDGNNFLSVYPSGS